MRRHLAWTIAAAAIGLLVASSAIADSWIFRPSAYSHNPATGVRVSQYLPEKPAYLHLDDTYMRSGYRHRRSALRGADGSVDRLHTVETWGAGEAIRPYGEWQRPFRAGATPYGPWGNPQGPWTTPFDSWVNPYGSWNRFYPHSRGGSGGGHRGGGMPGGGYPGGGMPGGGGHGGGGMPGGGHPGGGMPGGGMPGGGMPGGGHGGGGHPGGGSPHGR